MKCIRPWFSKKVQMLLPCGKCAFCIKKAIDAWCLRLKHEMEVSENAYFVTLTYRDEDLPEGGELVKNDLQVFMRSMRDKRKGLRYFAVGEYGSESGRPHYHAVLFNVDPGDIARSWPHGFVKGNKATMGRIRYMVQYMAMPQNVSMKQPPFRIMSRRPGIGFNYVEKMKHWHRARCDSVVYDFATPNAMPRFYRDKIFDDSMKLDLQERALAYSEAHKTKPDLVGHERLLKKLQRKMK